VGLNKISGRGVKEHGPSTAMQVIGVSAFFLLGMLVGYCFAGSCGESELMELRVYLQDYCMLYAGESARSASLLSIVRLYFFAVLLVFLLGFSKSGVVCIPLVSFGYGIVTAFSVACFLRVFGRAGIWPALAAFGPRLCVTIPCFVWVAAYSWSVVCTAVFLSRGKRFVPIRRDGDFYYCFCLWLVLLMAGVCVERYLVPHLFRLAASRL